MAKVYLSPSNHGVDQNKCLKDGCYEDKHTRPIADACARYLKSSGVSVKIGSANRNMAARCAESDSFGADLYVPIHTNAASADARYLLFMFWQDSSEYRKIFNAVAPALVEIYPGKVTAHFGVRQDLVEIKTPRARTIYCELGFHTNRTDVDDFIHDPEKVGKALAKGICDYLGVRFSDGSGTSDGSGAASGSGTSGGSGTASNSGATGAGTAVKLAGVPLYYTSTAKVPATHVTGTYYRWDDAVVSGRVRITNLKSRVGVAGQVTGWIDKKYV